MNSDTDARVTELEIKASFADDLLEQLNTVVAQQQRQIDTLYRELQALRQQLRDQERPGSLMSAHDERPPHY